MTEPNGFDRHFAKTMMALFPQKINEWSQDTSNPELKHACEMIINEAREQRK